MDTMSAKKGNHRGLELINALEAGIEYNHYFIHKDLLAIKRIHSNLNGSLAAICVSTNF